VVTRSVPHGQLQGSAIRIQTGCMSIAGLAATTAMASSCCLRLGGNSRIPPAVNLTYIKGNTDKFNLTPQKCGRPKHWVPTIIPGTEKTLLRVLARCVTDISIAHSGKHDLDDIYSRILTDFQHLSPKVLSEDPHVSVKA